MSLLRRGSLLATVQPCRPLYTGQDTSDKLVKFKKMSLAEQMNTQERAKLAKVKLMNPLFKFTI